jgi:hypothetical protein
MAIKSHLDTQVTKKEAVDIYESAAGVHGATCSPIFYEFTDAHSLIHHNFMW